MAIKFNVVTGHAGVVAVTWKGCDSLSQRVEAAFKQHDETWEWFRTQKGEYQICGKQDLKVFSGAFLETMQDIAVTVELSNIRKVAEALRKAEVVNNEWQRSFELVASRRDSRVLAIESKIKQLKLNDPDSPDAKPQNMGACKSKGKKPKDTMTYHEIKKMEREALSSKDPVKLLASLRYYLHVGSNDKDMKQAQRLYFKMIDFKLFEALQKLSGDEAQKLFEDIYCPRFFTKIAEGTRERLSEGRFEIKRIILDEANYTEGFTRTLSEFCRNKGTVRHLVLLGSDNKQDLTSSTIPVILGGIGSHLEHLDLSGHKGGDKELLEVFDWVIGKELPQLKFLRMDGYKISPATFFKVAPFFSKFAQGAMISMNPDLINVTNFDWTNKFQNGGSFYKFDYDFISREAKPLSSLIPSQVPTLKILSREAGEAINYSIFINQFDLDEEGVSKAIAAMNQQKILGEEERGKFRLCHIRFTDDCQLTDEQAMLLLSMVKEVAPGATIEIFNQSHLSETIRDAIARFNAVGVLGLEKHFKTPSEDYGLTNVLKPKQHGKTEEKKSLFLEWGSFG